MKWLIIAIYSGGVIAGAYQPDLNDGMSSGNEGVAVIATILFVIFSGIKLLDVFEGLKFLASIYIPVYSVLAGTVIISLLVQSVGGGKSLSSTVGLFVSCFLCWKILSAFEQKK